MNINIKTIPHDQQRYNTIGDYFDSLDGTNKLNTYIFVSNLGNEDYEFLVAIHEITEQYLCRKRGIKEEDISKFDIEFEENRLDGDLDEPGDDVNSPYRKEHFFATNIERLVAEQLGVDWREYEDKCNSL